MAKITDALGLLDYTDAAKTLGIDRKLFYRLAQLIDVFKPTHDVLGRSKTYYGSDDIQRIQNYLQQQNQQ